MDISSAIQNCRPVRSFDPTHKLSEKQVEQLLTQLFQAPPSINLGKWQFVVVQNEAVRDELRDAVWDQGRASDATLLIILCVDLAVWRTEPLHYWQATHHPQLSPSLSVLNQYNLGLDEVQRDKIMRSCGMVTQTLMLTAQSMGLDSCPLEGFDPERVGASINLPEDHAVCMMVAIGHAANRSEGTGDPASNDEAVVRNTY